MAPQLLTAPHIPPFHGSKQLERYYSGYSSIQTVVIRLKYRPNTDLILIKNRPFTDPKIHEIQTLFGITLRLVVILG